MDRKTNLKPEEQKGVAVDIFVGLAGEEPTTHVGDGHWVGVLPADPKPPHPNPSLN